MPTTFVLGAGASRDAGYPFAKDMGRGLLGWMEQAEPEGIFDFRAAAASLREAFRNAEDIEALVTWLNETTIQHGSRAVGAHTRFQASINQQALVHGLRRWFEQIGRTPSNSYRTFADQVVRPSDSIITFNYDVALDRELQRSGMWNLGDGYGFEVQGFPNSSKVSLLKLHGSMNWRALVFGGMRSGVVDLQRSLGLRPVFCDSDLRELGYEHDVDARIPRGRGVAMVDAIILPVREKQFFFRTSGGDEWTSFWDSLWSAAAKSLRGSDRIVICGYSVLPIDERACKMLLEDPEVTAPFEVCCGDDSDSIVERIRSFGRDAHVADQLRFGDWVMAGKTQFRA